MKRIPVLLFTLAVLLPAAASAQTRYATRALRLRAAPVATAEPVGNIPAGAAVYVRSCAYGGNAWCAVDYAGASGYAAAQYLVTRNAGAAAYDDGETAERGTASRPVRRTPSPASSQRSTRHSSTGESARRSSSASRQLIRGPRGGCYYYTASGRKQYVDRSLCH